MYVQPVVKPLEYIVLSLILAISILIGVYYGFKDRIHALFSCKKKTNNGTVEAVEMSSKGDKQDGEEDAKLTEYLTAKSRYKAQNSFQSLVYFKMNKAWESCR